VMSMVFGKNCRGPFSRARGEESTPFSRYRREELYALSSERWFDLFVLPGDSASSRSSKQCSG
jgi:hypothetical protein